MKNQLNLDAILNVGKVISVKGRTVEVLVSKTKNSSVLLYNGEIIKNVSVGSYIKICKGFEELVGKIEGEYITEDKNYSQKSYKHEREKIKRILSVSLLGYFEGNDFKQGIKELPLLDNECFLLTQGEVDKVHNFIKDINGEPDLKLKIGDLASEKGRTVEVGINRLVASHIGIFGNTGSGKSYTLASIYHKILKRFITKEGFLNNAKFLLIDFNGEYLDEENPQNDKTIIENHKNIYDLSTGRDGSRRKLDISKDTIYNNIFWSILLQATEKTQSPFINSALKSGYLKERINTDLGIAQIIKSTLKLITTNITANQEKNLVETFIDEISKFGCDNAIQGLNDLKRFYSENLNFYGGQNDRRYWCRIGGTSYNSNAEDGFYENVISQKVDELLNIDSDQLNDLQKIKLLLNFHYFYSIQKGHYQKEHIGHLLGRLDLRLKDLNKLINITEDGDSTLSEVLNIVSLKNVNVHMRKLIPLLLCKQVYEEKKEADDSSKYLNIIIDEAHNVLSYHSKRESEIWKDYRLETFEEIIKEGRKFGVFLTIASQRPYDISDTIISQLHNYFLHRLINNKDIEAIDRTVSYLDKVSYESLSILPTGTCILAGLSAHIPVKVEIDKIDDDFEPHNKTIRPTDFWN